MMIHGEPPVAVGRRISGTRREPSVQVRQGDAGRVAFNFVLARVTNMLVNDAVGVQVRCMANPTVPTSIMPSKSHREMRRHPSILAEITHDFIPCRPLLKNDTGSPKCAPWGHGGQYAPYPVSR